MPDLRFHNVQLLIETEAQAFGESSVEAKVLSTDKLYKQTYAGLYMECRSV
ncbi:hypothetical protein [Duganella sp. BuS-21]|uniref:hypothetical protein n=1 Tax=Duganella sp. BuS-21 TaxID=2943848 RepID=UPI0035A5FE03